MKKILKSVFYKATILTVIAGLAACGGEEQSGKLIVDGNAHTISIKEISYSDDGFCKIEVRTDSELLKKFEEFNSSPFWLGTINGKEYISASGKTTLKDGVIFVVEAPAKPSKIVIFTPDQESIAEFDEATLQVTPNPSVEEITNLIHSVDPELCEKFDSYQPLDPSQNGARISFDVISGQMRRNTFGMIKYGSIEIKSRQNYANEFTSHFYAVDAENPTKKLDVHLRGGRSFDNTEFFGVLLFAGNVDAKYAFIVFEGTPPDAVAANLITPTFFYIVELGDKYTEGDETYTAIKSYCKTPYSRSGIF